MRRYFYPALILLVLVVPFALKRGLKGDAPVAAPGALRLVVVTPNNQDICREFGPAFDAWHRRTYGQGVSVDFLTPGGTSDIKRLLQTTYDGYRDKSGLLSPDAASGFDVVWGGGDYFFGQIKDLGILQPLDLPPGLLSAAFPEPKLAGVNLYDYARDSSGNLLPPRWVGTCLSSFGLVYNPDLYQPYALDLPPPTRWSDLGDPKLVGNVALADPTHSGSAAVGYLMVVQRAMADEEEALLARLPALKPLLKEDRAKAYLAGLQRAGVEEKQEEFAAGPVAAKLSPEERDGAGAYRAALASGWKKGMGQLVRIAANARYFADSATLPPYDVANGEAAAGTVVDFYGRVYEQTAGPGRCRVVLPRAATAITPDPVALLNGAPHRATALRFVEFLLTPEGQKLWDLKPGAPGGPAERALRRMPVRRDAYGQSPADRAGWADPDLNPFEQAGGFNQRGEWMGLFADMQWLWAAAWIDGQDALQSAYRDVLKLPGGPARDRLLAALADLPIEMPDVERIKARRVEREKQHDDAEAWKARARIEWAERFRAHYRKVKSMVHDE